MLFFSLLLCCKALLAPFFHAFEVRMPCSPPSSFCSHRSVMPSVYIRLFLLPAAEAYVAVEVLPPEWSCRQPCADGEMLF